MTNSRSPPKPMLQAVVDFYVVETQQGSSPPHSHPQPHSCVIPRGYKSSLIPPFTFLCFLSTSQHGRVGQVTIISSNFHVVCAFYFILIYFYLGNMSSCVVQSLSCI